MLTSWCPRSPELLEPITFVLLYQVTLSVVVSTRYVPHRKHNTALLWTFESAAATRKLEGDAFRRALSLYRYPTGSGLYGVPALRFALVRYKELQVQLQS